MSYVPTDSYGQIEVFALRLASRLEDPTAPTKMRRTPDLKKFASFLSDLHRNAPRHPQFVRDEWSTLYGTRVPRHDDFDGPEGESGHQAAVCFVSVEQYQQWYDAPTRELLDKHGYKLVSFKIEPAYVLSSPYQASFEVTHAKLSEVLSAL